jgi:hypothetical protein
VACNQRFIYIEGFTLMEFVDIGDENDSEREDSDKNLELQAF